MFHDILFVFAIVSLIRYFGSQPQFSKEQKAHIKEMTQLRRGYRPQVQQAPAKERVLLWLPFGHSIVW